jgi:ParB-like chromosome segregation protein Spo0J
MKIEIVPIDSVQLDPANVRTHSPRNLATIAACLKRFTQQTPIVVDENGIIRKGNGTYAAAKSLGWTEIKIVRTALTGSEATAYAIADNRSGDPEIGSLWDSQALVETLAALNAEDADLAVTTGFTSDELAALINGGTGPIPDGADGQEFDESIANDVESVTCPHCGKEFPK